MLSQPLAPDELVTFHAGRCPDCNAPLIEGPHGGLAVNRYCSLDLICGSRFNDMGPLGVDRISVPCPAAFSQRD